MTRLFETASRASMGARRYQEDACAFAVDGVAEGPDRPATVRSGARVVAVLADGMGGHVGGACASRTACQAFLSHVEELNEAPPSERLRLAVEAANAALAAITSANPQLRGMGSTLVGAVLDGKGLAWASVGDSRLLLFRRGDLYQLNENHSLAPVLDRLAEEGRMSRSEALSHPQRHYLRSALTGEEIELVDVARERVPLEADDCIVLASDGIDTLEPNAIADTIEQNLPGGAEAVAAALLQAVLSRRDPQQDNTTVMVVTILES